MNFLTKHDYPITHKTWSLNCPVCGFNYVHILNVRMLGRESVAFDATCEDYHRFSMVFVQHEGQTIVGVTNHGRADDAEAAYQKSFPDVDTMNLEVR